MRVLKFSGAIAVAVDPNFTPNPRTGVMSVGSATLTVTQAGLSAPEGERLARLMFFQLFGRSANSADAKTWGDRLMANRAGTALDLFNIGETSLRSKYIVRLYRGLLKRSPEYGGWIFQRNTLASGDVNKVPDKVRFDLITNFVDSTEFGLNFGQPDNAEFVRIVYRQMLGREASQAEVDWQVGNMNANRQAQCSLAQPPAWCAKCTDARCVGAQVIMARDTLLVDEAIKRLEGGAVARLMFYALWLREAHPADLARVEAELTNGKTLAQVIADFVLTPEFEKLYK
jgi:hypothetical protein